MQKRLCAILSILAVITVFFNSFYLIKDSYLYSLDNLPEGNFVREDFDQNVLFSTGKSLRVYQVDACSQHPSGVRVELVNRHTNTVKNIYWQIDTTETVIYWPEDEGNTVVINGVLVDFENAPYDCRDFYGSGYFPPAEEESD